jgi:hypothetical protein
MGVWSMSIPVCVLRGQHAAVHQHVLSACSVALPCPSRVSGVPDPEYLYYCRTTSVITLWHHYDITTHAFYTPNPNPNTAEPIPPETKEDCPLPHKPSSPLHNTHTAQAIQVAQAVQVHDRRHRQYRQYSTDSTAHTAQTAHSIHSTAQYSTQHRQHTHYTSANNQ